MAQTNVSNSVLSIIASFANGLDVLKRLRGSQKKSTKRPKASKTHANHALQLSHSLRRGADDIGREYRARSMRCDSERYAVGDAAAQNSLAEVLIKLNTGLVEIITTFLNRDSKSRLDLDYQSLTSLSEHSRSQSITVLRQLYRRMVARRTPRSLPLATTPSKIKQETRASSKRPKARHPALARIVIENSSIPSQIALVRPSESKKARSQSHSHERIATPTELDPSLTSQTSLPPPPYFPSDPLPSQMRAEEKVVPTATPRHHRSQASIKKSSSRQLRQRPSVPLPSSKPPQLDQVVPPPRQSYPNLPPKPRPNTLYSMASARTASTKLGEIPMEKWPVPWDQAAADEANRLALEGGWPVAAVGGGEKKRGVWKRIFGRKGEAR